MKLRLPSDIEGGLVIFAIIIGITVIQLYFLKKVAAYAATSELCVKVKENGRKETNVSCKQCHEDGGRWSTLHPYPRGCCLGGLSHRSYPDCVPHSSNREYLI